MTRAFLLVLLLASASGAWARTGAEYAIRWAPKEGGPANLEAASAALRIAGKTTRHRVGYFEVSGFGSAPPGFVPIVRERNRGDRVDTTWKYRGGDAFPPGTAATWTCPLRQEAKRKDEVDVSILPDASVRRTFSRSCTAFLTVGEALPAPIVATPKGCSSTMRRRESTDETPTIEEWTMQNGEVMLEVSLKGPATDAALRAFRDTVVKPLLAAQARPLDRSKTEIGTQCGVS